MLMLLFGSRIGRGILYFDSVFAVMRARNLHLVNGLFREAGFFRVLRRLMDANFQPYWSRIDLEEQARFQSTF